MGAQQVNIVGCPFKSVPHVLVDVADKVFPMFGLISPGFGFGTALTVDNIAVNATARNELRMMRR